MTVAHWETVSSHFKLALSAASALATKAREEIGSDHLLLALSYQNGPRWRAVIKDVRADPLAFRSHIESFVDAHSGSAKSPPLPSGLVSPEANAVIGEALAYGQVRGCASPLNVGTLLFALANERGGRVASVLQGYGIKVESFRDGVERNLVREPDEL